MRTSTLRPAEKALVRRISMLGGLSFLQVWDPMLILEALQTAHAAFDSQIRLHNKLLHCFRALPSSILNNQSYDRACNRTSMILIWYNSSDSSNAVVVQSVVLQQLAVLLHTTGILK